MRKAHRELTTVMEQIAANREEVRSAREALDGERKRLARGSATILDVSILEENLTDAELSLLQSRLDLQRARVGIRRATGRLLAFFGLVIGPELDLKRS